MKNFLEYAQIAGMVLLLLLMLYANGNDWFGWGGKIISESGRYGVDSR